MMAWPAGHRSRRMGRLRRIQPGRQDARPGRTGQLVGFISMRRLEKSVGKHNRASGPSTCVVSIGIYCVVMILLIDNYDSFTYNLVQRIGEMDATLDLRVVRNDKITVDEAEALGPSPGAAEIIA